MKFKKNINLYTELANCIRVLTADAIEKAKSGHPGMPLGMAEIMTVLAFDILKYNPQDPKWFNRDRLILSNGHGSMLLYAFYYLTGYLDFTLDDIKRFRQLHSKTPGHPEYGAYSAIETTTGPLGQGFANAVGMSIAQKKYQQKYGSECCNYKIYVMVGDGCLMQGISYEAASLAGHLGLNNLIILFDSNNITIDGNTDLSCSEDQIAKFQALGWQTDAINGHDPVEIYTALQNAQKADKPVFILCKTIIGKNSPTKAGSEKTHGSPLGKEEILLLKQNLGFPMEDFALPDDLLSLWQKAAEANYDYYDIWQKAATTIKFTNINNELDRLISDLESFQHPVIDDQMSTRACSGKILEELLKNTDQIICGSADLATSNNMKSDQIIPIVKDDFSGNSIYYGVREHAMAAIMNGLALEGFLAIGGTFLIFSDYMRPAIRLAALMKQKVIYIFTHDSIGVGEDGPTHQPVEQLASLRSIPNLLVMRPANFAETLECWKIALSYSGPVAFALTRQNISSANYNKIKYGNNIDVAIFASGSEVSIAMKVAQILETSGIIAKVISVPCFELFLNLGNDYINTTADNSKLKVAIEAACSFGWHRIIGQNGMFFGVNNFGASAPYKDLYEYFGLTPENIAHQIQHKLSTL